VISAVVDLLRCPRCATGFAIDERSLRCRQGHVFDLAKHGYVNLTGADMACEED
jgi:23S rRNA (guanine745-N1)-methyltransferase